MYLKWWVQVVPALNFSPHEKKLLQSIELQGDGQLFKENHFSCCKKLPIMRSLIRIPGRTVVRFFLQDILNCKPEYGVDN